MKKILKIIFSSLLLLFISSFILALILTLTSKFIKNEKTLETITQVLSLFTYFFISFYIGKKIGCKGLIIGIVLSLLYIFSALVILNVGNHFLITIMKVLTITSGTIIGVNFS